MTSQAQNQQIVQVHNLNFTVQGRQLLKNISLQLSAGELLVVLGCNGAGKSTLLKHIAGELGQHQAIEMFQLPLAAHAPAQLARRRAVLPQSTPMSFGYTVHEVVMLGRIPHQQGRRETDLDRDIVRQALQQVGLFGYEERNCLTLSGGELQRVHLARMLAQLAGGSAEKVLLLDEPTSSLDLAHQHQTLRIARELCDTGVGVLAVLHDLNLAAQYANRLMILGQGQILAHGTPAEVLRPDILLRAYGHPVEVMKHPLLDCLLVISAS